MSWKEELLSVRKTYMTIKYPNAVQVAGVPKKTYKPSTANGLTTAICDFILYSGGDAQRINTTGIMRKVNGTMKWTRGGGRKGAADIHAIIKGRAVSIEVKIGKDKVSPEQIREKERIERAGGLYFIATDMDSFLSWYKEQFPG